MRLNKEKVLQAFQMFLFEVQQLEEALTFDQNKDGLEVDIFPLNMFRLHSAVCRAFSIVRA